MPSGNGGFTRWERQRLRALIAQLAPALDESLDNAVLFNDHGQIAAEADCTWNDNAIVVRGELGVTVLNLESKVDATTKFGYGNVAVSLINEASVTPDADGILVYSVGAEGEHNDDGTITSLQFFIYDEASASYRLRISQDGFVSVPTLTLSGEDMPAQPAAAEAYRGMLWFTAGGGGVADKIECCMKNAANGYTWVTVKSA